MILTKQQAAAALKISLRTLCSRMKSGAIKYRKTATTRPGQNSVFFDSAELGLHEPEQSKHDVPINNNYDDPAPELPSGADALELRPRELTPKERDAKFAAEYLAGTASDSIGNKRDGSNDRWPEKGATLIGPPVRVDPGPHVDSQSHMDPRLLASNDTLGNPIAPVATAKGFTQSGSPLADGLSQETYDAMMQSWRRSGGGPSMSEQEQAIRRAKENINRAFPRGERI